MISTEDKQAILLAVSEALAETEKEIQEDRRGFFNARTVLGVVRTKINKKIIKLFNDLDVFEICGRGWYGGRK